MTFKSKHDSRIATIAKLVLAACVKKEECSKKKQKKYVAKSKKDLAVDVMNFLGGMKVWLKKIGIELG